MTSKRKFLSATLKFDKCYSWDFRIAKLNIRPFIYMAIISASYLQTNFQVESMEKENILVLDYSDLLYWKHYVCNKGDKL